MISSNRIRRPRLGWASVAALALTAPVPAFAAPAPAQLTATFKDRDHPHFDPGARPPACTINFADIADARSSPDIVGVIDRRAVHAPEDVQAWMKAVLGGLVARGVGVRFEPGAAAAPDMPSARFTLQTAWIQSTVVTYSANVVVHLQAENAAGAKIDNSIRGRVARTAYWSGGRDTLQSAVDGAFADALDKMAVELKGLCGGSAVTPAAA
jgi:hypothetical protein